MIASFRNIASNSSAYYRHTLIWHQNYSSRYDPKMVLMDLKKEPLVGSIA